MKIKLNGKEETAEDNISIAKLLEKKDIKKDIVTIELNGDILKKETYDSTILKNGDILELVYFMGGGK